MERSLQQRLLGAAILVALLVIVVPEWLDGSGYRSRYPSHVDIPEVPEFKPMPKIESPEISEITPSQPEEPASTQPSSIIASEAAPTSDAPLPIAPAPVTSAPAVKPAPKVESAMQAWALQVGSFSDQKNALNLRDSLRTKGYTAYVEAQKSSGGTQYKVRIGPDLNRDRLDVMQKKLKEQENLNGVVVKHP